MKKAIDLGRTNPACTARWHGTASAYTNGCRCPHAREARRISEKRRRHGRAIPAHVDSVGVARRIQALSAIGWRHGDIAERLGSSWQYVQKLAQRENPTMSRRTLERISTIYRELSARPGPSNLARLYARRRGWLPPIAWGTDIDDPGAVPFAGLDADDDADSVNAEVDIELVVLGKASLGTLTSDRDRIAAVRRMLRRGRTRSQIARDHGLSWDTLKKYVDLAEAPDGTARAVAA